MAAYLHYVFAADALPGVSRWVSTVRETTLGSLKDLYKTLTLLKDSHLQLALAVRKAACQNQNLSSQPCIRTCAPNPLLCTGINGMNQETPPSGLFEAGPVALCSDF